MEGVRELIPDLRNPQFAPTPFKIAQPLRRKWDELPDEAERLRAGDAIAVRTTAPPNFAAGCVDALTLGRIIAVHYGVVPDSFTFRNLIYGSQNVLTAADIKSRDTKFTQLKKSTQQEQWGTGSPSQENWDGMMSYENLVRLITIYEFLALFFSIPDFNETEQESERRLALVDRYRSAVDDAQRTYQSAYRTARTTAVQTLSSKTLKPMERVKWEQKKAFYEQRLREVPWPDIDEDTTFETRAEIKAAMPVMLSHQSPDERKEFFATRFDKDVFANHFYHLDKVIDVKNLAEFVDGQPDYLSMITDKWAEAAERYFLYVFSPAADAQIDNDTTASTAELDNSSLYFSYLKTMHTDRGFDATEWGTFEDVPVRETRGSRANAKTHVRRSGDTDVVAPVVKRRRFTAD